MEFYLFCDIFLLLPSVDLFCDARIYWAKMHFLQKAAPNLPKTSEVQTDFYDFFGFNGGKLQNCGIK